MLDILKANNFLITIFKSRLSFDKESGKNVKRIPVLYLKIYSLVTYMEFDVEFEIPE